MDPLLSVSHLLFFNPLGLFPWQSDLHGLGQCCCHLPQGLESKAVLGAQSCVGCTTSPEQGAGTVPRLLARVPTISCLVPGMPTAGWTDLKPVPPPCHLRRGPHGWASSPSIFLFQHFSGEMGLEVVVRELAALGRGLSPSQWMGYLGAWD